ncbi:MAG: sugar ABC transporter ATP-binding protein [Chloroflexi bacterium]|nr:sugar ABC transporter ATP-binding protein [Chloroflexota bacterium]
MTFALEARGIRKSFGGVEVLHGVDLDAVGGSVLALLGENGAGKSTLVKIIAGDYTPDSGEIIVEGVSNSALSPIAARDLGVAIIFQEFQDAPTLTVAENISLGRLPNRLGFVDWRTVNRRAKAILDELGVEIDPQRRVSTLRVGERQIIEIARALSRRARLLILDEPTAALSHSEAETLFGFVRRLRDQGVAIIYITHRLDEVTVIADRVQVLRDGHVALLAPVAEADRSTMIEAMVGRSISEIARPVETDHAARGSPAIRWIGAGSGDEFRDASVQVHPGEVVAIYGKLGSGAAELGETAYGLIPIDSGTLEIDGKAVTIQGPAQGVAAGVGFLPADRKAGGGFMVRPVAENVAVASWSRLATLGQFISRPTEARAYRRWHDKLSIRSRNDPGQAMGTLSGGNQQKVLLGRWLERESRVLVLIEPTRGVDVGARQDIYRALRDLSADGVAILISTSDYEEAVQVADRVYVMAKGAIVADLTGPAITTTQLLAAAGG